MRKIILSAFLICSFTYGGDLQASEISSEQNASQVQYAPTNPSNEEVISTPKTSIVTFEDNNLEQALSDELGVAPGAITVEDMSTLVAFTADDMEISSLSGLEYALTLGQIRLDYNDISDISPLMYTTKLQSVQMIGNEIQDLTPLENNTNLKVLYMNDNRIENLDPITNFSQLQGLTLNGNCITDISPLKDVAPSYTYIYNQDIQLQDLTISEAKDLSYEIVTITGEKIVVPLGTPNEQGTTIVSGNWEVNQYAEPTGGKYFSGSITQNVSVEPLSTLSGLDYASIAEETPYSNQDIIELFNVTSSLDETISVDLGEVNISKPGDYTLKFADESGNELISTLSVLDVLPTISTDKTQVSIEKGNNIDDILQQLIITATEITPNDLISKVTYDDSNVDYDNVGNYQLKLEVSDEEGNTSSALVEVEITESQIGKPINPVDPVDPVDPADPIDPVDPVDPVEPLDPVNSGEPTDKNTPMTIADTGKSNNIILFISLLLIIPTIKIVLYKHY